MAADSECSLVIQNLHLSTMEGNLPNYEEATRALYRRDRERFESLIQGWLRDIREYLARTTADAFHG